LATSPAGRKTAKPASKQQTKAVATVNRLQLLLDDVIFSTSNRKQNKQKKQLKTFPSITHVRTFDTKRIKSFLGIDFEILPANMNQPLWQHRRP
jgi:hypothetical protein